MTFVVYIEVIWFPVSIGAKKLYIFGKGDFVPFGFDTFFRLTRYLTETL